jgi:exonuclease SbcC
MIIKKVALKNIKSYEEDVIEFEEGITSIHGLNGAGKSTVLESIGYALFDSLPYNQSDFVRKGEKTGEVSITIRGIDDIDYTITRKCGSSQSYSLRNDSGIFIEGKEDVGCKLCEILGYKVPDISQLRSLFENAVGVLQGTFVSEFLESPGRRKAIFDPLLRIDEYNTAHRNLLQLKNYVKGSIDEMEKDIRFMEGKAEPLERLKIEKSELIKHRSGLQSDSAIKKELMQKALVEKERYDIIEKALRDTEGKQKVLLAEKRNKETDIGRIKAELSKSDEAGKKMEQNKAGYERYLARISEREALEKQRAERDDLLKKMNANNAYVVELKTRLGECERTIAELEKYDAEIKTLQPLALEQEKLESEVQRIRSDINTREHETAQLKDRMRPLKTAKGNLCPILPDTECKNVNDFMGYFTGELARINDLKLKLEGQLKESADKLKALNDPRLAINIRAESLKKQGKTIEEKEKLAAQLAEKNSEQSKLLLSLSTFSSLEGHFKAINEEIPALRQAYDAYQQNMRIAGLIVERQKELGTATKALEKIAGDLSTIESSLRELKNGYDPEAHANTKASCEKLNSELASISARIESDTSRLESMDKELLAIEECLKSMATIKEKMEAEVNYMAFVERVREMIRMAGPEVIRVFIELISREATEMYCEIAGDRRFEIKWTQDYDILLIEDGRERTFRQLSGGEQMSAALAVRLAVLKILTSSEVVFLDEPTQNLDERRREHLAQEIMRIRDFKQMVIISHDDTFNASLENVIEVEKVNGESKIRRRTAYARPQATLQ